MSTGGFSFEKVVTVESVISQLEGGCIFAGLAKDGKIIQVKFTGKSVQPMVGDSFLIKGQLVTHCNKWGKLVAQVDTKVMKRHVQAGELLEPWLKRLHNVGPVRAENLVEAFGHDLPSVLSDPTRMLEVAKVIDPTHQALAAKIAGQLYAAMAAKSSADRAKMEEVEFLVFLEKVGINDSRIAGQLWRFIAGSDAISRLLKNPYVPANLMNWKIADGVGQKLLRQGGVQGDLLIHPARLMGGLASVWRQLIAEGDTAASEARVRELLTARSVDSNLALSHAAAINNLRRDGNLLRVPGASWIEDQVVSSFAIMEAILPTISIPHGNDLNHLIYVAVNATGSLPLTEEQHLALAKLLQLPLSVLQGGAGTGKTTVMKVLAYVWERCGGNVVLGALAGKAALQLSRSASYIGNPIFAHTLARLIGMLERQQDQETDSTVIRPATDVTFNSKTLFIIDEAGMMDTVTLYRLMRVLPEGTRILMAGDDGQLFPIGFGKVFHDLVKEGSRVATLTKVLRQKDGSIIPLVAAQVRSGKTPVLPNWNGEAKGVFLLPSKERQKVQRSLQSQEDVLVIAARRATVADINDDEAHARRTSTTRSRRLGPMATVANGDPIVITTNRYQYGLFNGLLGVVKNIEGERLQVLLDGDNLSRDLPEEAEGDVELAYSITCHKSQGSAADTVICMVEDIPLVSREWLYTAITRGRNLVLLVEEKSGAIQHAVQRHTLRTTGLRLKPPPVQA
jgi:exodeoxyribonuclease V alpha subunit